MARNYHIDERAMLALASIVNKTGLTQTYVLSQSVLLVDSLIAQKRIICSFSEGGMRFELAKQEQPLVQTAVQSEHPVAVSGAQSVVGSAPASTPGTSEAPRKKTVLEMWAGDDDAILNPTKPKAPTAPPPAQAPAPLPSPSAPYKHYGFTLNPALEPDLSKSKREFYEKKLLDFGIDLYLPEFSNVGYSMRQHNLTQMGNLINRMRDEGIDPLSVDEVMDRWSELEIYKN